MVASFVVEIDILLSPVSVLVKPHATVIFLSLKVAIADVWMAFVSFPLQVVSSNTCLLLQVITDYQAHLK